MSQENNHAIKQHILTLKQSIQDDLDVINMTDDIINNAKAFHAVTHIKVTIHELHDFITEHERALHPSLYSLTNMISRPNRAVSELKKKLALAIARLVKKYPL